MNTAPCIALSILTLAKKYDSNETMLVLPADHYISETQMFQSSIAKAVELAKTGNLITLGITPTYPATGYGYIERGYAYDHFAYNVSKFVEKPSYDKAVEYLEKGNFYWNSGMFCFRIDTMRNSFYQYQETLILEIKKVTESSDASERYEIYSRLNKMPIDTAIFEKADNILVLPVSFPWSDVGNWNSLSDLFPKDINENSVEIKGYFYNAFRNDVFSKKKVAILGVSDLVVVETDEALLVMNKSEAENVKNVVF